MSTRIGAYLRISQDLEREGLGVARQKADVARLAEKRGWEIVSDYIDNGVSAYRKVVRPEFERLLSDLESGSLDGLVVYDLDRLARQPRDLERLLDIYETRKSLVFATVQGDLDLSTSDGRFIARLMVNVANKSSADTSRRIKRKIREHAEQGRPHGSPVRPYGYSEDPMKLDPKEAENLRVMGYWFMKGYSYHEIANRLNDAKTYTRAGRPWDPSAIRKLLANPRYAGFRVVDDVCYEGRWERVFDRMQWDDLERMREARRENVRGRPNNGRYLLTRLLKCEKCRGELYGMTKRDNPLNPLRRTYQCRQAGCGMCIGAEPIEHLVREAVIFRLDSPELARIMQESEGDTGTGALYDELDRLEKRRDALVEDYADGTLTKPEFLTAKRRVTNSITDVELKIAKARQDELKLHLNAGETVRQAWERNADGWRRQLIEVVIESITVSPSTKKPSYEVEGVTHRFDPDRVSIKWKV